VVLPGSGLAGVVRVADIGFPDDLMQAETFLVEPYDVARSCLERSIDTHKLHGVLLVVPARPA